jgi:hypothetical protein
MVVLCNLGAPGTLTLPVASANPGLVIVVKDISSTTACSLTGIWSVDGGTITLSALSGVTVISDGANWYVISTY